MLLLVLLPYVRLLVLLIWLFLQRDVTDVVVAVCAIVLCTAVVDATAAGPAFCIRHACFITAYFLQLLILHVHQQTQVKQYRSCCSIFSFSIFCTGSMMCRLCSCCGQTCAAIKCCFKSFAPGRSDAHLHHYAFVSVELLLPPDPEHLCNIQALL